MDDLTPQLEPACPYPDIFLYCLTCSGVSAVIPVLWDVLAPLQAEWEVVHPGTEVHPALVVAHAGVEPVSHLLGAPGYKFLHLHRDPRDVLISATKDDIYHDEKNGTVDPVLTMQQRLLRKMHPEMTRWLDDVREWLQVDDALCFKFTFEELKNDLPELMERMLAFLGLPYDPDALAESLRKHSFEAVTGRKRGEDGPMIRNYLMWRKGVSGAWKEVFDPEVTAAFKRWCGPQLIELGFEPDDCWGPPQPIQSLVAAPYCESDALLVNALIAQDVCVTPDDARDQTWRETETGWEITETALSRLAACLPILQCRRHFAFRPDLEVVWETMQTALRSEQPVVLWTAEPLTALSAYYQQHCADRMTFEEFLSTPDSETCPFGLPPAETWAYLMLLWRALQEQRPILTIDQETFARDADTTTERVLRFLGVRPMSQRLVPGDESPVYVYEAHLRGLESAQADFVSVDRGFNPVSTRLAVEEPTSIPPRFWEGPVCYALRELGYPVSVSCGSEDRRVSFAQAMNGLSGEVARALTQAQLALTLDDAETAATRLYAVLLTEDTPPANYAVVVSMLVALRWTQRLLPVLALNTPIAERAFCLLRDLNYRFFTTRSVQNAMLKTLLEDPDAPVGEAATLALRLGEALFGLGQFEGAQTALLAASALAPDRADVWNDLAVVCWHRNDPQTALVYVQKALDVDPQHPNALTNLASMRAADKEGCAF